MSQATLTPAQAAFLTLLRSGEIPQTRGALRHIRKTNLKRDSEELPDLAPAGMCCLGVACEAYARETSLGRWIPGAESPDMLNFLPKSWENAEHDPDDWPRRGEAECLPVEVAQWLGITETNPVLDGETTAVFLNDDRKWTFPRLADVFEAYFLAANARSPS